MARKGCKACGQKYKAATATSNGTPSVKKVHAVDITKLRPKPLPLVEENSTELKPGDTRVLVSPKGKKIGTVRIPVSIGTPTSNDV